MKYVAIRSGDAGEGINSKIEMEVKEKRKEEQKTVVVMVAGRKKAECR